MREKTLLLIKPDGVARGLTDTIKQRLQSAGLNVTRERRLRVTSKLAAELYLPHLGKHFYQGLINFITSGPVLACQVEGENAIQRVRELMGATDPREAAPGTIRGDFPDEKLYTADGTIKNLVHGSDSPESAARELAIFFTPSVTS
jgi:nucleoside-diphosphate kinase